MLPVPHVDPERLTGKYIYLDNDFLGAIFEDPQLLVGSLEILKGYLVIDGHTKLEFLRDVWLPEVRENKEQFIASDAFIPTVEHNELFQKVKQNALELSRIYAHKQRKGISLVDLLLAGTIMLYADRAVLVTGNTKDYPTFLFDIVGVLNFEQRDGSVRAITVLEFNRDKFLSCSRDMEAGIHARAQRAAAR